MLNRPPAAALAAAAAATAAAAPASAELIYGLTTDNAITAFDSAAPSVSLGGGTIFGVTPGETLEAIDYRAATGEVYGIGDLGGVYRIEASDLDTYDAVQLNVLSPRLAGTSFAFDFNPAFMGGEFARIISDTDDNRVISGDTGQYLLPVEKTDVFYVTGDVNEGVNPNVAGISYTNSLGVPDSTQQFGIDQFTGSLVTVANNAGELETVGSLGVAPITDELGFDISGFSDVAYASLQNGPNSQLFTIDLTTGAASAIGQIGSGNLIRDITVIPVPEPASAALLALGGLAMLRRRK